MRRSCTISITTAMALALACARGGDLRLERAGELQSEYVDRKEDIDTCMQVFGECLAGAPDPTDVADCAGGLQSCLQDEADEPGLEDDGNGFPGDDEQTGGGPMDGDDPGDDPGDAEDGDDELGEVCEPLLDACLDDPANFDPFCLDDFEECIEIQVAFELEALCDDVVAECLALDIPNFDCFDVCP
ncbi:MAG TPA: hypothetical protein VFG69_18055 [Nannocystaceae bacterium]|nr:hypothetical protein [Nannocystaceae bacterium]